jgi:disease resistance protein RPM1
MAEAVVGVLVTKLGVALAKEAATFRSSLLFKEASALNGLFGEIREAKDELESMQGYLQRVERFKDTDETTGIFVNKIRGFAFEIEDVVDEFTYKLEDTHGGFAAKMKKRIKHAKTWRRLALKLQQVKRKLRDADERKLRYEIRGIDNDVGSIGCQSKIVDAASYFAKDDDLVGIEENKKRLMQCITYDSKEQSTVATVWGMGGVGKTTLVSHVYNLVKDDYDTAAWVTVSNRYQVEALLKMIAKQFGVKVDVASMGKRAITEVIYTHLQGKKYILILDDVWGVDVWFSIRDAFPTCSGSRFVITSRIHEVASLATGNSVVELHPLQEAQSWQLFCKEAFWKDQNRTCPEGLKLLAQKFVTKCSGLPIAIACIGRLLSCKQPTYSDWENVYTEIELQLTNNAILDVNIILKVSLEDLPYDLKNCFLHCALFPEDYDIKRRRVMRQWIAAKFVREKDNKTLEEVAERFLTQLVDRSLLQVVARNSGGRLKCLRMHDVIRLLALNKAKKECFGKVYDGSRAFSVEGTRRISIQSENIEQLSRSCGTHLRALHVFQSYININLLKSILESSSLLSTLDLQGAQIKILPKQIFNLFNLRYLGVRHTGIETLPEAIGRLQNLQVLDAYNTELSYLPNNVVKLHKLRYLYVCAGGTEFDKFAGVKVPDGMLHLTALRALQYVEASSKILHEVEALMELRTFGVCNIRSEHSADLCNALTKMRHLVHLDIFATGEEMLLQRLCLPPTISWLGLHGQPVKASMPWSHLTSLTRLQLSFSNIDEESFFSLLVLHGLYHLELYKAFVGKKLHFISGSFPKLRILGIGSSHKLNQAEIEDGAMASLVSLMFDDCPELKLLPDGIEHLRTLEDLRLTNTGEELLENLRRKGEQPNEDLMKISHIRKVTVELTKKNIWERIR